MLTVLVPPPEYWLDPDTILLQDLKDLDIMHKTFVSKTDQR